MTEILIPEDAQLHSKGNLKGKKVPKFIGKLITLAIVIGLLWQGALTVGRVAKTYFVIYAVDIDTAFDNERVRWKLSNYGSAKAIDFLNAHAVPDGKILVFRQSDYAYYARPKIVVFTDNNFSYLFRAQSKERLHQHLLDAGIKYIAVPAYAVAEINNSAFSTLLSSDAHARLFFDADNEKIFEILDNPPALSAETVLSVDFSNTSELDKWHATKMPMSIVKSILTPLSEVTKDISKGSITLSRKKPALVDKDLIDVLQPWDLQVGTSPYVVGKTDFEVINGVYRYRSTIAADGFVSLYVEVYERYPDGSLTQHRKLVWSGVVKDKEYVVQGITTIQNGMDDLEQSAKLFFTLSQGGYLTIRDLDLTRIQYKDPYQFEIDIDRNLRARRAGWVMEEDDFNPTYGSAKNTFGINEDGVLRARQVNSRPMKFHSAPYLLPVAFLDELEALKLQRSEVVIEPVLILKMEIFGRGSLKINVSGQCVDGNKEFSQDVGVFALRAEINEVNVPIKLNCVPASVKMNNILDRDYLLTPPNFEFGDVNIASTNLSLQVWQKQDKLSEIEFIKSKDVQKPSPRTAPQQLPVGVDF